MFCLKRHLFLIPITSGILSMLNNSHEPWVAIGWPHLPKTETG